MKTKILKSLLLMATIMMPFTFIFGATCIIHQLSFKINFLPDSSQIPEEEDPEGLRKPGNTVSGHIGTGEGIQIPGFDKSRILSYEIYK